MTNTNSNGGSALVATRRVLRSTSSSSTTKNSSNSHDDSQQHLEDAVLVQDEEEKLMAVGTAAASASAADEEITSLEEDNIEETMSVEHAMISVALVQSVVEASATSTTKTATTALENKHALQLVAVNDGAIDGQIASPGTPDSKGERYGLRKRIRPSGQALERLEQMQSSMEGGLARHHTTSTTKVSHVSMPTSRSRSFGRPKSKQPKVDRTSPSFPPSSSSTLPVISSVPNPLSRASPSSSPFVVRTIKPEPMVISSSVPCPLPAVTVEDTALRDEMVTTESDHGEDLETSACLEDVMNADCDFSEKRRVTIMEPSHPGSRIRGFSIDMDLGLDFCDDGGSAHDDDASDGCVSRNRDRAFSFECFAFGINADEPLPPIEPPSPMDALSHTEVEMKVLSRPRGDSIIFDPASFQDGGIHEQTALEKVRLVASSIAEEPTSSNVETGDNITHPVVTKSTSIERTLLNCNPVEVDPIHSSSNHSVTVGTAASAGNSCALVSSTMSLELVNKDGRIGIYLPEARRARIARFHAKREKRIWRKRIKYDCRKKLADSRPRIKGRFVKRTDMDD